MGVELGRDNDSKSVQAPLQGKEEIWLVLIDLSDGSVLFMVSHSWKLNGSDQH